MYAAMHDRVCAIEVFIHFIFIHRLVLYKIEF